MEFLKNIFGDESTGVKWGGVVSAGLLTLLGANYGGWVGGALGLVGGTLLGPVVNEIFFNIGRAAGIITPPGRDTTIVPRNSTNDLPGPVLQPDGSRTPTTVRVPVLDNLNPPDPAVIAQAFAAREQARQILVTRSGDRAAYDEAVDRARTLERASDGFTATIEQYFRRIDEYNATGGERDQLVAAVERATAQQPNRLTAGEIQRFVPHLRTPDPAMRERVRGLLSEAMPAQIELFPGAQAFPAREYASQQFVASGTGTAAQWAAKTPYEQLNFLLNTLDNERAQYEFRNPINWERVGGQHVRDMSPRAMYDHAVAGINAINSNTALVTEESNARKLELEALKRYALMLEARARVQTLVQQKVGGVLAAYTQFRTDVIGPDFNTATQFATRRLGIFNETAIAVFAHGQIAADRGPDSRACHFITMRDCNAPSGSGVVTLVAQEVNGVMQVTHRLDGQLPESGTINWTGRRLTSPITVNGDLFRNLTGPATALRELATAARGAPVAMLNPAGGPDLRHLVPEGQMPSLVYTATDTINSPTTSGQVAVNNREKPANPFARLPADMGMS